MGRYDVVKAPGIIEDFLSTGKVRIFIIRALQDFHVSDFDFSDEGGKVFDIERSGLGKYHLKCYGYGTISSGSDYDDKSYGNGQLYWILTSKFEVVNGQ